eukprot:GHVU01212832.1.p1 GENE.GHVU01212832.1~~GHVU01212832.1.p1  ORF type:complete len:118 (+),score=17.68 GHVU01212832.1:28-354(+)
MAEATLRDDGGTPAERAHRMAKAAEVIGQAARTAEETSPVTRRVDTSSDYRGELRDGTTPHGIGVARYSERFGCYVGEEGETLALPAGSVDYEGEWRNGVRHGLGVLR